MRFLLRFTLYPANMFGFAITAGGLLAVALYAAFVALRGSGKESWMAVDLRKVGVVITGSVYTMT